MEKQILAESLTDLQKDLEELIFLFSSSNKQLQRFQKDIEKQKDHIISYDEIRSLARKHEQKYQKNIKELRLLRFSRNDNNKGLVVIRKMLKSIRQAQDPEYLEGQVQHDRVKRGFAMKDVMTVSEKVKKYFDIYRSFQSIIAGLITSTDWQSPSFHHTTHSMAGKQTGKIVANYNDYKRDQHIDAKAYAHAFRKEYIDGLFKFTIPTYMVNSGMAALTTILNFLEMEQKITGPILLGSSSYFQNKELIQRLFTGVIEVHEHDTEGIKEIIANKQPSVIFFDSLCNSYDIAVPNLKEIVQILRSTQNDPSAGSGFTPRAHPEGQAKKDVYIIIDNTCLASSFQPLQLLGKFPKNLHMIVFESMNKYYQFGLDKTMGGVIYGYGKDMDKLFFTRQHSGTILSDVSCYLLPPPQKSLLKKRLARHERNIQILIEAIQDLLEHHPQHPIQGIVYPSLKTHSGYAWAKDYTFHGSYFTFTWQPKYDKITVYQKFITNVLKEAKKHHVNITEGTSFGFNTSRIYLTAKNTKFGKPFVRFSVGTENRYEIEKVKEVLIKAIQKISN